MKKQAFSYLARVGVQKIIGFLLYLIGAEFALTYAEKVKEITHGNLRIW